MGLPSAHPAMKISESKKWKCYSPIKVSYTGLPYHQGGKILFINHLIFHISAKTQPFKISFISDALEEGTNAIDGGTKGFKVTYWQEAC